MPMHSSAWNLLHYFVPEPLGRSSAGWNYARPILKVAREFKVSTTAIYTAMETPGPLPGKTWLDWLIAEGIRIGLTTVASDGGLVSNWTPPFTGRGMHDRVGRPRKW